MSNYQKHLSLDDRILIEEGICKGLRKFQIAELVGKSPSTIAKEIKKNRKLKIRNTFNDDVIKCIHLNECKSCSARCKDYEEPPCFRRDRFIGAFIMQILFYLHFNFTLFLVKKTTPRVQLFAFI